jgi:hypothetical protein
MYFNKSPYFSFPSDLFPRDFKPKFCTHF